MLRARDRAARTRYGREAKLEGMAWRDIPTVDLLEFLCHSDRFAVGGEPDPGPEAMRLPFGGGIRTAVVGRRVSPGRHVRCFDGVRAEELLRYQPQILAAPADTLRAAGEDAEPLDRGLIVFTGILEGPLRPADGSLFWSRYQVPMFEQFLGFDGELLAWECEAHEGLHIRESAAYFEAGVEGRILVSFLANARLPILRLDTGLTGRVVMERCACGVESPRLVELQRRVVRRPAVAAAALAAPALS